RLGEGLRDGAQLPVEEGAREVAARLDVGRVGRAPQRERHLLGRGQQRVSDDLEPDRVERHGITGSRMWLGRAASRWTVLRATRVGVWRPGGSPGVGVRAKGGELEVRAAARSRGAGAERWPVGPEWHPDPEARARVTRSRRA